MASSSRRKSCLACARGKRRCDLGFPQCDRCLGRGVTCAYPWISPEEAQQVVNSVSPGAWMLREIRHDSLDQRGRTATPQWNYHLPGPGEGHTNDTATSGPLITTPPVTLAPALVPLLDEIIGRGRTLSFVAPDPQFDTFTQSHCLDAGSALCAPQPSHNSGFSTMPLQIASDSCIITGSFLQARTEYAAIRLVQQVTALAEAGQTAFIHHSHIETSPILQEALAACALYGMRNSLNSSLIRSEIARRARLLVDATETAISVTLSSPHSAMELDLLPAVQGMLIYQCMQRFSTTGNVEEQAQAELDAKSLAKWVGILEEQTQWLCNNNSVGTQLDVSGWKDWVRAESLRRTVVFAELLDSIYNFLRFGWYRGGERMAKLCFTGQAALWEARSAAEWYQASWHRLWFEVNLSRSPADMESALPEDLDELGIIILVCSDGVEGLKEWLNYDRRLLERWGLSSRDTCSYVSAYL